MPLTAGTKLGPYEVIAPLGAGGMGEVYRATDTRLDRIVAIKILPLHLSDNPEAKQRFEREARTISSLNHPHMDSQRFVFATYPESVSTPLVLVTNWTAGLTK